MLSLSTLQMNAPKAWSGVTSKNHLGAIWQQKPQVANEMITQMLSQARWGDSLENFLNTIPAKYVPTDADYTWQLIGSSERNIPLVAAYSDESLSTLIGESDYNIGAEGAEFFLVFDEAWFADTDVIVGEKNEKYPIRILEDPTPYGNGFVYRVQLFGTAKIDGVPGEELLGGKVFSKDYSPVEDSWSVKGGETTFTAPMTFRNSFTRIRKQYRAPGNMRNRKFAGGMFIAEVNGKKREFSAWMDYQNWVFEYQFAEEKDRLLWYGRGNRNLNGKYLDYGKSGQSIEAGAGLREQMEVSNTHFYNTFSIKLMQNILTELSEGKLGFDQRKFMVRTGERGATMIHEAIEAEALGWAPLFDQSAQRQVSSELHKNAREYGYQYTQFLMPNGIELMIAVDKMYDDRYRNKLRAPKNDVFNGGVAESYRMDILDVGTVNGGEANIRKVYAESEPDLMRYIPGLRNPFSPDGEFSAIAVSTDGYEVHRMATCSGMITDPSRTASLIPAILD